MGAEGWLVDTQVSYDTVSAWLRDAGFSVEAQLLLGPGSSVPGALLFARR